MNYAVIAPIAAAAVALFAALQALRLAVAPGWGDQAWFAVAAVASAGFAVAATVSNADVPAWLVVGAARSQLAFMVLEVWALLHYGEAFLGQAVGRWERRWRAAMPALALSAFVPGLVLGDHIEEKARFGAAFFQRSVEPTWCGTALVAACLGLAVLGVVRFTRAWRRGVPRAGLHALAIGSLLLLGSNDALVLTGALDGPFLLDVGFVLPVALVGGSLASRLRQDALELSDLRQRLEALVQDRTRDLSRAQDALSRAERLAALGHFAAGVAHEVNNPAAVVSANLRFVRSALPTAPAGADEPEIHPALDEAIEAMGRITGLVRRMVDAGRLATAPRQAGATEVREGLRGALAEAQAHFGGRIRWRAAEAGDLRVGVAAEVLHDVLLALLLNAGEAVPPERAGSVEVEVDKAPGGLLRLSVRDDGRGLAPLVAARAFEPFFSTKPAGRGSGLGLSVAQALAETHGGSLRLAARPGGGAEAVLELPLAAAAPPLQPPAAGSGPHPTAPPTATPRP